MKKNPVCIPCRETLPAAHLARDVSTNILDVTTAKATAAQPTKVSTTLYETLAYSQRLDALI